MAIDFQIQTHAMVLQPALQGAKSWCFVQKPPKTHHLVEDITGSNSTLNLKCAIGLLTSNVKMTINKRNYLKSKRTLKNEETNKNEKSPWKNLKKHENNLTQHQHHQQLPKIATTLF